MTQRKKKIAWTFENIEVLADVVLSAMDPTRRLMSATALDRAARKAAPSVLGPSG